jgi:alcohol dehydrogenase
MRVITLSQPGRIVFGNGCATGCAGYLASRGSRRLLLITSAPVLPCLGPFIASFREHGAEVTTYGEINSEPTVTMFEAALGVAAAVRPDAILGMGGGSAMDVAKLVAALTGGSQSIREVFGIDRLARRGLFLVCLPTTSGTGSEVSPNAILLDETDQLKKGVISPHLLADVAFVDPLLTLSVPPAVTAATGLDALVHCIEAYANKFAHPLVDLYALQGIRLIGGHLLRAVKLGSDGEARAALALGSLYGGLCLGPVNTAAVHALAYPLGGAFHVAHGVSNAVLLPHVLRFNLPAAAERYAEIALALGADPASTPLQTAEGGLAVINDLVRQCGVPEHLAELGVPALAIRPMAEAAMTVNRLLKNNPRPVTLDDAIAIYQAAY